MGTKLTLTHDVETVVELPEDRPIVGKDVLLIQEEKNMRLMDITWEFAWYNSRHNESTLNNPDAPLPDVTRAILARMYAHRLNAQIPFVTPKGFFSTGLLPVVPSFKVIQETIRNAFMDLDKIGQVHDYLPANMVTSDLRPSHISVLLGFNGNSASRWEERGPDEPLPNPCAGRVCTLLHADYEHRGVQAFVDYLHHVEVEAKARAIPDGIKGLLSAGKWASSRFKRRGRPSVEDKQAQLVGRGED